MRIKTRKNRKTGLVARLIPIMILGLFLFSAALGEAASYDPEHPENLEASQLSCSSAILINADTGDVIFEKNADVQCYPASTTKIMTALLALNIGDPEQICVVSQNALNIPSDSSAIGLAVGEELRLIDLIYGTMLVSGNDGANVIAENLSGSIPEFVNLMNYAAEAFGCTATHFENPHGYHDENHYSTARDMAIIARTAMQNETIRQVVQTRTYTLPQDNIYRARSLANTNKLITFSEKYADRYYQYATGIKTGHHSAAGYCLVSSAVKNGVSLIAVVFNSSSDASSYRDSIRLFEYGFTQFVTTSIRELYAMNPRVIDISGFDLEDRQLGRLELKLARTESSGTDLIVTTENQIQAWLSNFNALTLTEYTHEFRAPINEGDVMGTLSYYAPDGTVVVYNLVASRSVAARESLAPSISEIIERAENDKNPFPRLTFELVFVYLFLPVVFIIALAALIRFVRRKRKRRVRVKHNVNPKKSFYR